MEPSVPLETPELPLPTSPLSSPPTSPLHRRDPPQSVTHDFESPLDALVSDDDNGESTNTDGNTPGLTEKEKLAKVVETLRQVGWSLRMFIDAFAGKRNGCGDVQLDHQAYKTTEMRHEVLSRMIAYCMRESVVQLTSFPDIVTDELNGLIGQPFFHQFDQKSSVENFDYGEAVMVIKEKAPQWYSLLLQLMRNERSHRVSYRANPESSRRALDKRILCITSLIVHSRAKQRSNHLPAMLGIYLLGSGTKRRVVDTLAGLGICQGYHQCTRVMNDAAQEERRYISRSVFLASLTNRLSTFIAIRSFSLAERSGSCKRFQTPVNFLTNQSKWDR